MVTVNLSILIISNVYSGNSSMINVRKLYSDDFGDVSDHCGGRTPNAKFGGRPITKHGTSRLNNSCWGSLNPETIRSHSERDRMTVRSYRVPCLRFVDFFACRDANADDFVTLIPQCISGIGDTTKVFVTYWNLKH